MALNLFSLMPEAKIMREHLLTVAYSAAISESEGAVNENNAKDLCTDVRDGVVRTEDSARVGRVSGREVHQRAAAWALYAWGLLTASRCTGKASFKEAWLNFFVQCNWYCCSGKSAGSPHDLGTSGPFPGFCVFLLQGGSREVWRHMLDKLGYGYRANVNRLLITLLVVVFRSLMRCRRWCPSLLFTPLYLPSVVTSVGSGDRPISISL